MRRRKYGNEPTEYEGRVYDSKAEARRAWQLDLLLRADHIVDWIAQPLYHLGPDHKYRADFEVSGHEGKIWTEDVKGPHTRDFARHKRMWRKYGPHTLIVLYAKGASGWRREDVPAMPATMTVKGNL